MDMSFDAAVAQLRNVLGSFTISYNRFMASREIAQSDPQLWSDWQAAKTRADNVADSIRWINRQIDSAVDWFSNTVGSWLGFSGLRGLDGLSTGMGQLGVLPLVPVAYIVGATAALVAAKGYMDSVSNRADEIKARFSLARETGDTSVITSWDKSQSGGFWSVAGNSIGTITGIALIGVAAYFLIPKLQGLRKR